VWLAVGNAKNAVSGTALPLCSAPIAVPASKAHALKGWALRRENITARKRSIVCAAVSFIPLRRFFVRFFRLIGIENILQTCYIGCMKIIVFFAGRP
jgi:hypothetical protein